MLLRDIREEKAAIRSKCRLLRSQFTAEEKKSLDARIFNRLMNLWRYRECGTLLTYVSNDIEVDTHALIEDALKRSKRVAVPRCIPGLHEMEFYYINSFDDLQKGAYGILEPIKSKCEKLIDLNEGLCIIPALTFDEQAIASASARDTMTDFCPASKGIRRGYATSAV